MKLGLGDGRFARTLRRFDIPLGLGLRLLIWEIGDVNPLPPPPPNPGRSNGTGATIAIESIPSLSSTSCVRSSAALSNTVGTD